MLFWWSNGGGRRSVAAVVFGGHGELAQAGCGGGAGRVKQESWPEVLRTHQR